MQNESVLSRLYRLLGADAILIPIPAGQKKPKRRRWEQTTLEQSLSPEWQAELLAGNIGVLLGMRGNGIVTIDCDSEDFAVEMLALNPCFIRALQSSGSRGRNFWLHCQGDFPQRVAKLKDRRGKPPTEVGEWRADGGQTVIHGLHPSGCHYRIIHEAPPLPIAFGDIRWPDWLKSTLWTKSTKLLLPMQHSHTGYSGHPATQQTQSPSYSADTVTQRLSRHRHSCRMWCFCVCAGR